MVVSARIGPLLLTTLDHSLIWPVGSSSSRYLLRAQFVASLPIDLDVQGVQTSERKSKEGFKP